MKALKFFLGLALGLLILLLPLSQFQAQPLHAFQTLAVQLEGRKKPLDTVALETVTQIHGSPRYTTDAGEKLNEQQTFLSMWCNNRDWNQESFILLNYRPLKESLGLDIEQKYFSFTALMQSDLGKILQSAEQRAIIRCCTDCGIRSPAAGRDRRPAYPTNVRCPRVAPQSCAPEGCSAPAASP